MKSKNIARLKRNRDGSTNAVTEGVGGVSGFQENQKPLSKSVEAERRVTNAKGTERETTTRGDGKRNQGGIKQPCVVQSPGQKCQSPVEERRRRWKNEEEKRKKKSGPNRNLGLRCKSEFIPGKS